MAKTPEPPPAAEGRLHPPSAAATAAGGDPLREILERVGQMTRDSQGMLQQLVENERRFRRLAKAVWRVQEEERRRLAREIHDGLGQNLTALKHRLELLARQAGAGDAPSLQGGLAAAVELAARLLQDTRELSRLLRPPILDDLGLVPALRWLARTLREGSGLDVCLEIDLEEAATGEGGGLEGWEKRLSAELETLIFRVAQEALTNVLKHSGAAAADLALRARGGWLMLAVEDRGAGFDLAAVLAPAAGAAGCGLSGVRDRVELFGGRCRVRSAPGAGTRIEIEVPLSAGDLRDLEAG